MGLLSDLFGPTPVDRMPDAMVQMARISADTSTRNSDNMFQLGLARISSDILQANQAFSLGKMQIQSQLELGREALDNKLEIARLNFQQSMSAEEDRHAEKMADIDVRKREIDLETRQTSTSSFLS